MPNAQPRRLDDPGVRARRARPRKEEAVEAAPGDKLPSMRGRVEEASANVSIGDLDALLNAVKARLKQTVSEQAAEAPARHAQGLASSVRDGVLECVDALDQLHTTLKHELARRLRLEMEVFDAQTALAQARAELLGTQAGEKLARHQSLHDSLTALPNRTLFRQRLDAELLRPELGRHSLALLYLDLDDFKPINDTHGHAAGDQLLRVIGARLARAVRGDDLVGRLGGDEFACLLVGLPSRDHVVALACKLFHAVALPFNIGGLKLCVRPSIGIALCPVDGSASDVLLQNADAAMYRAKRFQTGYAFFDAGTDA